MSAPIFHLPGQTAVVTGAAQGIGRAIAEGFLAAGCRVVAVDADADAVRAFAETAPDQVDAVAIDVTDFDALAADFASRSIDHVVCAAAIGSGQFGFPFWKVDPAAWSRVLDVTLLGCVNTVQAAVPALRRGETHRKSVLLLASIAGQIGSPTDPPYSAAKAGVINFMQVAARDFAADGIRCNALSPGMVKTALNRRVFEASEDAAATDYETWAEEKIRRVSPLGRWQEPDEFAAAALFLASDAARNITGQTWNIDGGQVMHA